MEIAISQYIESQQLSGARHDLHFGNVMSAIF
jgi:hypothetical protein